MTIHDEIVSDKAILCYFVSASLVNVISKFVNDSARCDSTFQHCYGDLNSYQMIELLL